jgi:hypothetical protein
MHCRGFGLIGTVILIPLLLIAAVVGWYGYCEARKAYWDKQVEELCNKDGGVHILEKIKISKTQAELLPHANGRISVASKELATPNAPVYAENTTTYLRSANPNVRRYEEVVVRRVDQRVVARWIYYARVGGDFPSPAHESHFGCPDLNRITLELDHMFIVEGN